MPKLCVDIREQQHYIDDLRATLIPKGFEIEVGMYEVADYFIGNQLGIEHKTPSDFVGSVLDERIFKQAVELSQNFDQRFIVVDGHIEDVIQNGRTHENSMWAAVNSLNARYRVPVLFCGPNNFSTQLYWLAMKATDDRAVDYTPVRKQAPTKDLQLYMLASLPGMGQEKARRVLKVYGSPLRALNSVRDWSDHVDGIGKKTVERILTILTDEEVK